ncbi:hypothetical protein FB45DRAFT_353757 [Roridomyces roridus]|uniref:F-box domain-containing protein n=1 Tax=Roridomyces roridus TaxID=1738132 RepID=A0AAD7FVA1_9AGAR|nr:hypothetical protein FB45DRAFT_353668 [Roridomyces roridus]KAJ7641216.1 hypothetical protein FB45DRAFT_353757 [Roridomyces roridus]
MNYSQAARAADRARVVELDAQIHELQEQIRVLQLERDPCKLRLDSYRYPVLTLPNEIVSEIFVQFLPPYPDCPPLWGLDSPTTLTHICCKWREIALADPMLWRSLSINSYVDDGDKQLQVVQAWLERSGSCPLSIDLESSHEYYEAPPKGYLIATFLHRERWQHGRLDLRAKEVALIEGPMPLLESLSLAVDHLRYTHPATMVGDLPRLRSVTLDDAHHGNWLPLSQLTALTLKDMHDTNYFILLQDAVNLVHLYLIQCTRLNSPPNNITLTRIETLVMLDCLGGQTLDLFTLPALRGLQWSGELEDEDPICTLTSLVSRSGCKLQQVLLTGTCDVSEESLQVAFPSIPKVTFETEYDWYSEGRTGFKNGLGLEPT